MVEVANAETTDAPLQKALIAAAEALESYSYDMTGGVSYNGGQAAKQGKDAGIAQLRELYDDARDIPKESMKTVMDVTNNARYTSIRRTARICRELADRR